MRIFSFSLMGYCIFSLGLWAQGDFPDVPSMRIVTLNADKIFIPKGFDYNDNAEIVVTGWYPTPCYEWAEPVVRTTENQTEVYLKALVKEGMDTVCINMAVPFTRSVKLGSLKKEGVFQLSVGKLKGEMEISKPGSMSSIDDYIYGQVQQVKSDRDNLVLEIQLPSDCIELDRVKNIFNGKDTCSVLPIMKQVKAVCPRNPHVKEYHFQIPRDCLKGEETLFHVRSLEGQAINYLMKTPQ